MVIVDIDEGGLVTLPSTVVQAAGLHPGDELAMKYCTTKEVCFTIIHKS